MNSTQEDITSLRNELEELRGDFTLFMQGYNTRQAAQEASQERNTEAIEATNKNVADLVCATKGLIEAWKVANGVQRFLKWFSAFAILITWLLAYLPDIKH